MSFTTSNLIEFRASHVKIKDRKKVDSIVNDIISGGFNNLQIVTDFDFTITKQKVENGKTISSFGLFNKCKSIPQSYLDKSNELYNKYRPIEIDPHMPREEKIKYMIEWWTQSEIILNGFPFSTNDIEEAASAYKHVLRCGASNMLKLLNEADVPVLVFSAGLGDSVVAILKTCDVLFPNVKVISNFLRYQDNHLVGLSRPIIHTFNKNETALVGTDYYESVKKRSNVIVMGDSLGDAQMADGMPHSAAVLKIGFLYDHVDINLPLYMDTFDIVLIDDQTMNIPLAILSLLH